MVKLKMIVGARLIHIFIMIIVNAVDIATNYDCVHCFYYNVFYVLFV